MPNNLKRSNENENLDNTSKKFNYNLWNKDETPLTPPQTPTSSSNNKYDFNIWNKPKSTDESVTKPITIFDLKVGICMENPLIFRVSFKSKKRRTKNGDMFVFHAMDSISEIQVTVFPQQTTKFFDVIQFNRTYEMMNFNVKKESEDFPNSLDCRSGSYGRKSLKKCL